MTGPYDWVFAVLLVSRSEIRRRRTATTSENEPRAPPFRSWRGLRGVAQARASCRICGRSPLHAYRHAGHTRDSLRDVECLQSRGLRSANGKPKELGRLRAKGSAHELRGAEARHVRGLLSKTNTNLRPGIIQWLLNKRMAVPDLAFCTPMTFSTAGGLLRRQGRRTSRFTCSNSYDRPLDRRRESHVSSPWQT